MKGLYKSFDTLISDQDKAKLFQEAETTLTFLSDFMAKEKRWNSDISFYEDIAKPYLRSLRSNLDKRFPSIEIVDVFGIFDWQHATEHNLYETGMQKLHSLPWTTL